MSCEIEIIKNYTERALREHLPLDIRLLVTDLLDCECFYRPLYARDMFMNIDIVEAFKYVYCRVHGPKKKIKL